MSEEHYIINDDQIARLKDEIERLRRENAILKKWDTMTDEQTVMDLKAEINRLKGLVIERDNWIRP